MTWEINVAAALDYARSHVLDAIVIERADQVVAQEYGDSFAADKPHALYSGTKSFWGPVALRAQTEGLLSLDELVAETISEWREDPWKRRVTLRMLLSLTAGFGFGGLGASVPVYERALAIPLKDEPGTRFTYGGIPLQVFGAVLAQKLVPQKLTPHEYLRARILDPAGVTVASWRSLADGTQPLPTGAFLTAGEWLSYGRYVLRQHEQLAPCFQGSAVNERYGLGWWLRAKHAREDLVHASGSAGQALYVVPSLDMIVVHFGRSASYKHETFLRRLFN